MSLLGGRLGASARVGSSRWRRFLVRFDWPLFVAIAVLIAVGMVNLYSATHRTPHSGKFDSQLIWVALGMVGFFLLTAIDYHVWHRIAWLGLGVGIVAIVAVRFWAEGEGAQRWIDFSAFRIQPSELAKIAVIVGLARLVHDVKTSEHRAIDVAPYVVLLAVPVGLIASQPDLGTAVVVALIILSVCFLTLKNLWPITGVTAAGLALLPILWDHMHSYQKNRVLAFLDPAADPTGTGWHTQQSIFAVGSGRLSGKGFLNATQNHFNFLPEYWTDFPFSVWAEEWGFVGSVALLAVFTFLILWIVNVASNARDTFGTCICLGVGALIFWHVVVNIAMVLGLAPVVGLTLPLVSYGGSSMITILLGLGLVSSVSMRRT